MLEFACLYSLAIGKYIPKIHNRKYSMVWTFYTLELSTQEDSPSPTPTIYGFGLCFGLLCQIAWMKEMKKSEERRKNNTEKINPASWFSILKPEQFNSDPAQEETSEEKKIFPTPPPSAAQTHETNILLLAKGFLKSQAQMI